MRRAKRGAGRLPPWLPGIALGSAVICSARGCRAAAVWALEWNNPRLHTPDRRKTWVACDEHRETLAQFLAARGFLRDTVPVAGRDDHPGR